VAATGESVQHEQVSHSPVGDAGPPPVNVPNKRHVELKCRSGEMTAPLERSFSYLTAHCKSLSIVYRDIQVDARCLFQKQVLYQVG
jgi:hypothetical protein